MNETDSERPLPPKASNGLGKVPRWLIVALVGLLALIAGAYAARTTLAPSAGKDATALFAVTLPDLDGREQKLEQWRGKVLVVNFWATWCAPCREEMPQFIRSQAELGAKGLQFVGIAVDQADKAKQFAKEINLNYPTLVGGMDSLKLSSALGNDLMALPFTVVVGRDGNIVHTQLGPLKQAQFDAIVGKLI
ncbi:MAG: redoxin family protein [Betaproteobacteria bacterium]